MLTVGEAADQLGVSAGEVRRLIRTGVLPAERKGRMLLLADDSIARRIQQPVTAGRAFTARTAWAALWEMSGLHPDWLDRTARSRLRRWLRTHPAEQLTVAVRDRADRRTLRVLPAYRARLLDTPGVHPAGLTAADVVHADIVTLGPIIDEVYCTGGTLARLQRTYKLSERAEANLVVRIPKWAGLPLPDSHSLMPEAVIAVDLAESADPRTRRAGLTLLEQARAQLGR